MITLLLTPEEKAILEELARVEDVTLSHALRGRPKLYSEAREAMGRWRAAPAQLARLTGA